jgi:hypothetical protein
MRLLSIIQWHHFAYMIISLALLGYGVSGTVLAVGKRWLAPRFAAVYVASATLFGIAMIVCFALAQRIPFNALEVVWDPRQLPYLAAIYLLFFIPFFFAASCIALSFVHYKELINRIYLADLLGAGVGAAGFRPEACLKLLAVIALAAAVVGGLDRALRLPRWVVPALGGGAAAVVFALPQSWIALQMSPYKGLSQALQVVGTRVLGEYTNPLGLLTVVESPTIPFRYAPGLSLKTRHEPPPQLGVFTDGDALSAINRDDSTAALPYQLLQHPKVLVLGAGGGSDVLLARFHEVRSIDAVELNPLMIDLVRNTYARFAGDVYGAEDVRVHVAEARGFVARSAERFDLIQVALLDSFAASSAGVHALSESYIYTVEATGPRARWWSRMARSGRPRSQAFARSVARVLLMSLTIPA